VCQSLMRLAPHSVANWHHLTAWLQGVEAVQDVLQAALHLSPQDLPVPAFGWPDTAQLWAENGTQRIVDTQYAHRNQYNLRNNNGSYCSISLTYQ
jgi:hypothetical protein